MAKKLSLKHIVDSNGIRHEVDSIIGEGAQGYVLKLKGGKLIAKLVRKGFDTTEKSGWIDFLKNEEIDKKLFGKPIAKVVQPRLGYIAEFASGMEEIKVLRSFGLSGNKFRKWFIETGGLLRRIIVLRNLAKSLKYLHSKGLVYADLSMNNIFISELGRGDNVFLIDTDNITYKSSVLNSIYTPMYGAPEVVRFQQPNSMHSDCHAFAVIAYEILTQSHPLIGDYVDNGSPELEDKALRGELAWVDHSSDKLNSRSTGLPSKIMMSDRLFRLFELTFDEGLNNPVKRPSMGQWCDELERLTNCLIKCPTTDCAGYYVYRGNGCSFCGSTPKQLIRLKFWRWDPLFANEKEMLPGNEERNAFVEEILMDIENPKKIRGRHFLTSVPGSESNEPLLQLGFTRGSGNDLIVEFVNLSEENVYRSSFKGKSKLFNIKLLSSEIKKRKGMKKVGEPVRSFLHLKDLDKCQRVMTIEIDE